MKKITLLSAFIFLLTGSLFAQLPSDYPFKTYVDSSGNLYVTGCVAGNNPNEDLDIWFVKYRNGVPAASDTLSNPGVDRGYDIISDEDGYIYITGYMSNGSNGNDIVFLKYDSTGSLVHIDTSCAAGDDRGYCIAYDGSDIYIGGYKTASSTGTDMVTLKYAKSGSLTWDVPYNNGGNYDGDDFYTHIVYDDYNVYMVGSVAIPYSSSSDIVLIVYSKDDGDTTGYEITHDHIKQVPTACAITNLSHHPIQKSELTITGWETDNLGKNVHNNYITAFMNRNGSSLSLEWVKRFGGTNDDIATACIGAGTENVLVTGYSYRSGTGYDFATINYETEDGDTAWVLYFDSVESEDRASNIKTDANGDAIVSGYCEEAEYDFIIKKYESISSTPVLQWSRNHEPGFTPSSAPNLKRSTFMYTDAGNNVYVFMFRWSSVLDAEYEAVKLDSSGNELYTIDDNNDGNILLVAPADDEWEDFKLEQNFPNPFNPVTNISYSIPTESHVILKIYDMAGRETAVLVNENLREGSYNAIFNAAHLPSGTYIYRLTAVSNNIRFTKTARMILVK